MRNSLKITIKILLEHGAFIASPVLCLLCLFLACGHAPGQDVKIIVNMPKPAVLNADIEPVSVSIQLESSGNTFFKKNLIVGENRILLPKGSVQVSSGFFAKTLGNEQRNSFAYTKVQQEITISNNTNSLEIYYPQLKPVMYRKFGFIFQNRTPFGLKPLSQLNVTVQDPMSETDIKNPQTGENLGFISDDDGHASADLPVFEQTKKIRLMIHPQNREDQIFIIPVSENGDGMQFYNVILDKKITMQPISTLTGHYTHPTKTIQEILNADKNPRFPDSMTVDEFQSALNQEFKTTSANIDILSPLTARFANIKPDNPYMRAGREIRIQCKPNKGSLYKTCAREISGEKLKTEFGSALKTGDKIDFLLIDQDNYSIFSDKTSTREHPAVITVTLQ